MKKNTKLLKLDPEKPDIALIKQTALLIKKGALVVFPTDTVYGLGTNAFNKKAIREIYRIKKRPLNKPVIFLIGRKSDVRDLADSVPKAARKLIKAFWPGPLTLILKSGTSTLGVRMPKNRIALGLIRYSGVPVATTSANISGAKSSLTADFGSHGLRGKVDVIIDGGKAKLGVESTIVDVTVDPPRILRQGYITKNSIKKELR
ncbi:MAG: L-threonylcarbamoyladenylate synthase [bacterium]